MLQNTGSSWDVRHIDRHHAKIWCLDDGVTIKIGIIILSIGAIFIAKKYQKD